MSTLDFHIATMQDREWAAPILTAGGAMGSEAAFGTLYIWGDTYGRRICRQGDMFLSCHGTDAHSYTVPIGPGDLSAAVKLLMLDAEERGKEFRMWGVTAQMLPELEAAFPGKFEFREERDVFDYIYNVSDLTNLSGRRYHGKRNHIAQFERGNDWSYEEVTVDNLADCRSIARQWCEENGCGRENGTDNESCAIKKSFANFEALGFSGGLIRVDGKPVAFTMGEAINKDVFLMHFEKAVGNYNGLYPTINHEFVARHLQGYQYVNREEDLGIEGLRKAKLSYYPAILLEKYCATLKAL